MTTLTTTQELFTQGMEHFSNEDYPQCIALLSQAIDGDPDFKLALSGRGTAFLKSAKFQEAVDDFTRVLELDPDFARGYHRRGLAKAAAGDAMGAIADFDRAIELDPEYGAVYYSRATLMAEQGQEEAAATDMKMVAHFTQRNLDSFANANNVWQSDHLRLEDALETELER